MLTEWCQAIMVATVEHERLVEAEDTNQYKQIFQGINFWRLFIAFWPKAMQQLTGQSITNNYGTYFCKFIHRYEVALLY